MLVKTPTGASVFESMNKQPLLHMDTPVNNSSVKQAPNITQLMKPNIKNIKHNRKTAFGLGSKFVKKVNNLSLNIDAIEVDQRDAEMADFDLTGHSSDALLEPNENAIAALNSLKPIETKNNFNPSHRRSPHQNDALQD